MGVRPARAIDLLILDVNDVLYRYDTGRRIALLAESTGTTPDDVRAAVFDSGVEARSDIGELGPDGYLAAIGDHLGVPVDRAAWTASLTGAVSPMPHSIDLIRRVAPAVRTVGLSNNGRLVKEQAPIVYPALRELGIELYVSAEFGGSKPDARVYLGLCDRLGATPGRAAFVDDKPANADGATAAGLHGHRFTGVEALATFLRDLGVEPAEG